MARPTDPAGAPAASCGRRGWLRAKIAFAALLLAAASGCRSAPALVSADALQEGVSALTRSLPGELAALYRLRVAATGGLRLTVLTAGPEGRLTISEPFGAAVSVAAWNGAEARLYDLDHGCRMEAVNTAAVLGVGRLPLPQAARLLAGRLPALPDDVIVVEPDQGTVAVLGNGWTCRVVLAAEPWRVVRVEGEGWTIRLDHHTSSVPGFARLTHEGGRWAELELVRLEWPAAPELPTEPELPPCAAADGAAR